VSKPSWQKDPNCPGRTVADVSAVAWNIPVYDPSQGGWLSVGGTSAAAPLIAGLYALAGNATKIAPGYAYAHSGSLFDITAGNNGWITGTGAAVCGGDYLCQAAKGYDAPTGLGTPDGTGAF
jgi:subtilase family serine protease